MPPFYWLLVPVLLMGCASVGREPLAFRQWERQPLWHLTPGVAVAPCRAALIVVDGIYKIKCTPSES